MNIWEKLLINNMSVTCNVISNVLSAYHSLLDKKGHSIKGIHQLHNCIFFIEALTVYFLIYGSCPSFSWLHHPPAPLLFALWEQRFVCLYICLFLSSFIFLVHYLWHLKLEWCLEHSRCLEKVSNKQITDNKWINTWVYYSVLKILVNK